MSVYIVSHKEAPFLENHPDGYVPLLVGQSQHELERVYPDAVCDDKGDSISSLNPYFCELTALYWVWKNTDDEVKGVVHYRRFFLTGDGSQSPMGWADIQMRLQQHACIVPISRALLQKVGTDYDRHHVREDLLLVRDAIMRLSPEYIEAFNRCMSGRYIYPYNMLIASGSLFDHYCEWLFPVLMDVYRRIDFGERDSYQKRAIGFLSERLFKVWLIRNNVDVCEQPISLTERDLKEKVSMALSTFTARLFANDRPSNVEPTRSND